MGFLERIVKRQVRRIVNNAVDEFVDNTVGEALRGNSGQNGREGTQNYNTNYDYREETQDRRYDSKQSALQRQYMRSGEKTLRKRLMGVFVRDYPDYEVRSNLDAGVNGARKYSYGLYYNGMPRMMIMVLPVDQRSVTRDVKLAKEASESYGVPYLNFFSHLPNEVDYIRNRIRENM